MSRVQPIRHLHNETSAPLPIMASFSRQCTPGGLARPLTALRSFPLSRRVSSAALCARSAPRHARARSLSEPRSHRRQWLHAL
jgi:hypothetical protein